MGDFDTSGGWILFLIAVGAVGALLVVIAAIMCLVTRCPSIRYRIQKVRRRHIQVAPLSDPAAP